MDKARIISLGFEGSHRSGKGTQIEIIAERLKEIDLPFLVVRGDGSRPNKGNDPGDPYSK